VVVVVVVARIPQHGIEGFRRYEHAVLPLLADHGGEMQRRFRNEDGTIEVHLVGFSSAETFARYRSDPRRERHAGLLQACGARVEVLELSDAPIEELLPPR